MIIKVDVDGVIRDIFENMCELYNKTYGQHTEVNDIFDYDVDKSFPLIKEKTGKSAVDFFFKEHALHVFFKAKAYDSVKEFLQKLRDKGHKIVIVTWQFSDRNKIFTLTFLSKEEIPYDDICFTRDKWMIASDIMIDDNPEFINDDRDKTPLKLLKNMPYNLDVECDESVVRFNELEEIIDYF